MAGVSGCPTRNAITRPCPYYLAVIFGPLVRAVRARCAASSNPSTSAVSDAGAPLACIKACSACCAAGVNLKVLRAPPAWTRAAVERATRSEAEVPRGYFLGLAIRYELAMRRMKSKLTWAQSARLLRSLVAS